MLSHATGIGVFNLYKAPGQIRQLGDYYTCVQSVRCLQLLLSLVQVVTTTLLLKVICLSKPAAPFAVNSNAVTRCIALHGTVILSSLYPEYEPTWSFVNRCSVASSKSQ